jgi:chemotaxis protein CheZ
MTSELTDRILAQITSKAEETIRHVISQALTEEIHRALTKALSESEFYKTISVELHRGLGSIYKEIHSATAESKSQEIDAQGIFSETSQQLDAIVETTEKATEQIIGIVEKHLDTVASLRDIVSTMTDPSGDGIRSYLEELDADLMTIMTALSFQDLTGQRIKRIIRALDEVQRLVFDLYLDAGLSMKALAENPEQSIEEIRQATKTKVSELKGPQLEANQQAVDDLLSQLGL